MCQIRDSIVASIPACHAGDRGSIPRRGVFLAWFVVKNFHTHCASVYHRPGDKKHLMFKDVTGKVSYLR